MHKKFRDQLHYTKKLKSPFCIRIITFTPDLANSHYQCLNEICQVHFKYSYYFGKMIFSKNYQYCEHLKECTTWVENVCLIYSTWGAIYKLKNLNHIRSQKIFKLRSKIYLKFLNLWFRLENKYIYYNIKYKIIELHGEFLALLGNDRCR